MRLWLCSVVALVVCGFMLAGCASTPLSGGEGGLEKKSCSPDVTGSEHVQE